MIPQPLPDLTLFVDTSYWIGYNKIQTLGDSSSSCQYFIPIIESILGVSVILVRIREHEPFEKAMRRFRRKVEREGIRKDIKKNNFYLKPGEKKRLQATIG